MGARPRHTWGSPRVEIEARRLDGSSLNVEAVLILMPPPTATADAPVQPAGLWSRVT
jgi:hypothetical protein